MKRFIIVFSLFLSLASVFTSCSTKVDLYADYKDIPVVYGLINATLDTNYIKIIRAFSGSNGNSINANDIALIPDSNNYPGKLDARIYEYKASMSSSSYYPTGRVFLLDTTTIRDKESGTFYAPDQKVYFTTEHFNTNDAQRHIKYKYRLEVFKGTDTISGETNIVGGENFYISNNTVDMDPSSQAASKLKFFAADNAALYEIKMRFTYKEIKQGHDTVNQKIEWSLGTFHISDMTAHEVGTHVYYELVYDSRKLFDMLGSKIGDDTFNVERLIGKFDVMIAAGGYELYDYIEVSSPSSSIAQSVSDYTNINGGYGVLSSRVNISKTVNLTSNTITALIAKEDWGFRQDLGK